MARKKKDKSLEELKNVLKREDRFYANITRIRLLIRVAAFSLIALSLYLFDIILLDEMIWIFLALILVEYLRYRHKK